MPRTIAQAEALDKAGIHFDVVLSLEIADSVIEARMTGRRTCHGCGATYHIVAAPSKTEGVSTSAAARWSSGKDDQPETVKRRLEVYHQETEPLKEYYQAKGLLQTVPDLGGIEATNEAIMKLLGK